MNRQAIAFLTMFSLVLMLAVYYVTMPIDPITPEDTTPVISTNYLLDMQTKWDAQREAMLDQYAAIIASTESSSNDKSLAMEQISYLKQMIEEEKNYQKVVSELGFTNNHIEIEDELMRIMIMKEEATAQDASIIIKAVLVASDYKYMPEVTFHEE